ncbi:MAG: hypothetical protein R3190_01510 [Thermoanaerobaculia bacterium]|nr:hypothetical protein [Thermoanaerobaculia bacterium]
MPHVLLIAPFEPAPSGLPLWVAQWAEALDRRGHRVTWLAAAEEAGFLRTLGAGHPTAAAVRPTVLWPREIFEPSARERLLFALEGFVRKEGVDALAALDVARAGYVAAIAAGLQKRPFAALVRHADAYGHLLRAPTEVELVCRRADLVAAPNPALLDQLELFHDIAGRSFCVPVRVGDDGARDAGPDRGSYLATTGVLDGSVDVWHLIDTMRDLMPRAAARSWCHVGAIAADVRADVDDRLASLGLAGSFEATGLLGYRDYERTLRAAKGLVKAHGQVDTGLSVLEANRWGLPTHVPSGYPVVPELPLVAPPDPHPSREPVDYHSAIATLLE